MSKPNDVQVSEHFKLSEFADRANDNLVVIHPLAIFALEGTRAALCRDAGHDIAIIVTCGTRTPRTNSLLGELLGWTNHGGLVSLISKHLPCFGGIAVDFYALDKETGQILPTKTVAAAAEQFFDVVIDHYPTHTHGDMRDSAKPEVPKHD